MSQDACCRYDKRWTAVEIPGGALHSVTLARTLGEKLGVFAQFLWLFTVSQWQKKARFLDARSAYVGVRGKIGEQGGGASFVHAGNNQIGETVDGHASLFFMVDETVAPGPRLAHAKRS